MIDAHLLKIIDFTVSFFSFAAFIVLLVSAIILSSIIKQSPSQDIARMAFHYAMSEFLPVAGKIILTVYVIFYFFQ